MCSRCGANLEPLMRLAAHAWRLRAAARDALAGGDCERAFHLATRSEAVRRTPAGRSLRLLSEWLRAGERG